MQMVRHRSISTNQRQIIFGPGSVHLAIARNNLSHSMGHDSVSGVTNLVQARWRTPRMRGMRSPTDLFGLCFRKLDLHLSNELL
jgi:hypothetical protein